jgi:hypothetical protein
MNILNHMIDGKGGLTGQATAQRTAGAAAGFGRP